MIIIAKKFKPLAIYKMIIRNGQRSQINHNFIVIYFFLCSLFLFYISEIRFLNFSENQIMKNVIDVEFLKDLC